MIRDVILPQLAMGMSEGKVVEWLAREGGKVERDKDFLVIETEKVSIELPAPYSGFINLLVEPGAVVPVETLIARIADTEEEYRALVAGEGVNAPTATRTVAAPAAPVAAAGAVNPERTRASGLARKLAAQRGVALDRISGSGPGGRIVKRDIEKLKASSTSAAVNREWLKRGEGAPIVLIHGFCADLTGWLPIAHLLPEGRPALAIDLPGHGLSPLGEDASFEALVEAARDAMIEEGASEAHLVGHSLGGAVAAALAQAPGVNALSLMLIAPAGLGEETNPAFFEGFLQANDEATLRPWMGLLVADPAAIGSAMVAATLRQRAAQPIVAAQRRLAQNLHANGRQAIDVRPYLVAPRIPVKVVFGDEDRITPAHHAENLSGLVALHRFSKIGHMPHFEARREVARLIEELARAGDPD